VAATSTTRRRFDQPFDRPQCPRLRPGALLFQTSRLGASINLALEATGQDEVVLVDADTYDGAVAFKGWM
jgi:hypothetical protein